MEPQFNTSFIPKKSLQEDIGGNTPGKYVNRRTVHGSGFYLTLLVFIITSIAAGGIFFYTKIIQENIHTTRIALDRARAAYKPEMIERLRRADNRLKGAYLLATTHAAASGFLTTLEESTLKTVRYSKLELGTGIAGPVGADSPAQMIVSGDARDLRSVALQVDEMRKHPSIKDPGVSKLERSATGGATFTLQAQLDSSFLSYSKVLDQKTEDIPVPALDTVEEMTETASTTDTVEIDEGASTTPTQ
jgi:hypothetical protein